ncbi:DUF2637 domain-containing protein [Streptomyces vilmorinianum]|uniref:DUF2637 domain-containing protein n=1 Tax=Streptomyces vilmorinianum TaxID=3051092 RepID=UPI0010FB5605|nr:DUF2637 domain-containing protein [Streptomyces vilmorinianum]
MAAVQLTRTHKMLIGVVIAGAVIIAGIGFAGSYAAVRELAVEKGFGTFSYFFPIGIDAGICVLLALDLLLTWIRIPFPLLRQTAWVLTAATIAFNGAAAWPDPLGVGMHAVIPVLFVVAVEAARHAVGRIADITADKHMEGVRITRWLLSPIPTFRLWRRMKLWELRSYEQVIKLEQDRLIYQARLQARFGRAWRRKAPVEALMPLRLAKYGVPLAETAAAGLAAAGVEPMLIPPQPTVAQPVEVPVQVQAGQLQAGQLQAAQVQAVQVQPQLPQGQGQAQGPAPAPVPVEVAQEVPANHDSPWFAAQQLPPEAYEGDYAPEYMDGPEHFEEYAEHPGFPEHPEHPEYAEEHVEEYVEPEPPVDEFTEAAYKAMWHYVEERQDFPNAEQLDIWLSDTYGVRHPRSASLLRELTPRLRHRIELEMQENHIP